MEYIKKNKKILYLVLVLILVGVVLFLNNSYAYFEEEVEGSCVSLEVGSLAHTLKSEVTVASGESKKIKVVVSNVDNVASKYQLVYSSSDDLTDVVVGYSPSSIDLPYGSLAKDEEKYVTITVQNNSAVEKTVYVDVRGGLSSNSIEDIILEDGEVRITEVVKDTSVNTVLFANDNLGENCKTYDDGVDTFLVGQCSNNYVWYSGKLWRVVLKNNETGAVKMVTDNAITVIPYNSSGNTAFKDSYMDQWLTQEFLPTLHDYEDYLVTDSIWDATESNSDQPTRPVGITTVTRTVGLLNAYEYYTTYNNSNDLATYETVYLNNDVYWSLLTPFDQTYLISVDSSGLLYDHNDLSADYMLFLAGPSLAKGVRPSINLKSTIEIDSGIGTQSDPYVLKGDVQETTNGITLLSTRYSGEYITFNSELYRIVGVENGLTKIIAVDKPSELESNKFNSTSVDGSYVFLNSSIKTDLENYYQLNATSYNMVQQNTIWYPGIITGNYKEAVCSTVDANVSASSCIKTTTIITADIGLPRIGEMFTSQITRKTKSSFWVLTEVGHTHSSRNVNSAGYSSGSSIVTQSYGARPSMYLKSGVKIASNNTGNGTFEKPYSVELGQ